MVKRSNTLTKSNVKHGSKTIIDNEMGINKTSFKSLDTYWAYGRPIGRRTQPGGDCDRPHAPPCM